MSDETAREELDDMPDGPSDEDILSPLLNGGDGDTIDEDAAASADAAGDPAAADAADESAPADAADDTALAEADEPRDEAPEPEEPEHEPEAEPLFAIPEPAVAEPEPRDVPHDVLEPVFEFTAEPAAEDVELPVETVLPAQTDIPVTQVLPALEPLPGHEGAPDFFSAAGPREIEAPPAPHRIRVPWLRVLVLPRSTFRRLEEVRRAWPGAFAFIALAAIAKGGLAIWIAMEKPLGLRIMAVLGLRYGLALLGPILFALFAAGLVRGAQRWWQGDAPFGRLLSAFSLALAPLALRDLVQAAYIGVTRTVLVHSGLAALVAPPTRSPLRTTAYAALSTIDLFTLWAFVLVVMAASVTRGRGRGKGVFIALLLALIGAGVMAAASVGVSILLAR